MGGFCCTERDKSKSKDSYSDLELDSDISLFDFACANKDIDKLIDLLDSEEILNYDFGIKLHSWACTPKSVAVLACTQLTAMAVIDEFNVKNKIVGKIPKLIELLGSDELDKSDAALIFLSFLSIEDEPLCRKMYEHDIFDRLIKRFNDERPSVKASAAQLLRNIYVQKIEYRENFIKKGGFDIFIDLLSTKDENMLLEILYHIDDLLTVDGMHIESLMQIIPVDKLVNNLDNIDKNNNPEINHLITNIMIYVPRKSKD